MSLEDKKAWRAKWKASYPRDPAELARLSEAICAHVMRFERFRGARRVALFWGLPWEPDLSALWRARPGACVFPRCLPQTVGLEFHHVDDLAQLEPGHLGIREPRPRPESRVAAWGADDLILVPGRAFDRHGGRIGGGMGYYDRFLATHRAYRLGIAFDGQITAERLAQEPTDARMDALCSESGILRISVS